ncbi:MAG: type II 3-dehydroquinate dehydratase [Thermonemataceae bacterium]
MDIIVINGPNLNLLGKRETTIYGTQSFEAYFEQLKTRFPTTKLSYFQSNSEGAIIDKLQEVGYLYKGIVLNAGAYTHTSIAIADALAAIESPVIEVHISQIYKRESFRHHSYISTQAVGCIVGLGLEGYALAIQYLTEKPKV